MWWVCGPSVDLEDSRNPIRRTISETQSGALQEAAEAYVVGLFDCCREKVAAGLGGRSGAVMDFSGGG